MPTLAHTTFLLTFSCSLTLALLASTTSAKVIEHTFNVSKPLSEEIGIRNYDKQIDKRRLEELERSCEVGPIESANFIVDTLGDPIGRIRNSSMYKMLVAEIMNKELVGMIQGTIKIVTAHLPCRNQAIVGYILGIRVSPLHRRKGIGLRLVQKMEQWFTNIHVDFAYMATENDNEASVKLFTNKLQNVKLRTPSILVNPISQHLMRVSPSVKIVKLKIEQAERLYRRFMGSVEFLPHDIDSILKNQLSLGTWIAYRQGNTCMNFDFDQCFLTSWALLSVWNSGEIFKLILTKPSLAYLLYARSSSFIDRFFPCFKFPFLPDVFNPFGFYFMYGLHQEGPGSGSLMHSLCQFVHNMATKNEDCKVIVAEVGGGDTLRLHIPHSKLMSCPEDWWCMKALKKEEKHTTVFDQTRYPHPRAIFTDPREV